MGDFESLPEEIVVSKAVKSKLDKESLQFANKLETHRHELMVYANNLLLGKKVNSGLQEDVVQEAFTKAIAQRSNFDNPESSLRSWLYTAVRNGIFDILRREKNRPKVSIDELEELFSESDPLKEAHEEKIKKALLSAIKQLPPNQAAAFTLYILQNSTKEASERLGIKESTYKMRALHAREFIRAQLENAGIKAEDVFDI